MFVVEPFDSKDLLSVMRLASRVLPEEYPYEFFLRMARGAGRLFRVAREAETGQILGFIVGGKKPGLQGDVLLFAVDPQHQGRGIGHALIRDLQRTLALDDVRELGLEVRTDNVRAIHFYQREGFRVTSVEERVYKDGGDAFWMTKPLL